MCPAGYARSYVRTWVSSDGAGKTGDHWELVCVLSAVEARAAPETPTVATLLGFFVLVMAAPTAVAALWLRSRLR